MILYTFILLLNFSITMRVLIQKQIGGRKKNERNSGIITYENLFQSHLILY